MKRTIRNGTIALIFTLVFVLFGGEKIIVNASSLSDINNIFNQLSQNETIFKNQDETTTTIVIDDLIPIEEFRYKTAYADPGYELEVTIPSVDLAKPADSYEMISVGSFSEFKNLYLDGNKLNQDIDYSAVAGSTRITIQALTFSNLSVGDHSLMLEFRTTGTNELKTASQIFTVSNTQTEAVTISDTQETVVIVQEVTATTEESVAATSNDEISPILINSVTTLNGTLLEDGRYLVGNGDNLSKIAREYLEAEKNWTKIYQLNTDIIKDPNLIYKGQILKLQ